MIWNMPPLVNCVHVVESTVLMLDQSALNESASDEERSMNVKITLTVTCAVGNKNSPDQTRIPTTLRRNFVDSAHICGYR